MEQYSRPYWKILCNKRFPYVKILSNSFIDHHVSSVTYRPASSPSILKILGLLPLKYPWNNLLIHVRRTHQLSIIRYFDTQILLQFPFLRLIKRGTCPKICLAFQFPEPMNLTPFCSFSPFITLHKLLPLKKSRVNLAPRINFS